MSKILNDNRFITFADTEGISIQNNLHLGPTCKGHEVNMHMLEGKTIFYYEDEKLSHI